MTEKQLRNKVVSIMQGWLGWNESNGKHKKIIDIYNSHKPLARGYAVKYTDDWFAAAVSAAFISAGLTDIGPTECSCAQMVTLYKKIGRWMEDERYTPNPGDLILYDWGDNGIGDNTGTPRHVGIVEKVSGGVITAIEGNRNKAVSRRTIAVNGRFIRGYCLPDYAAKVSHSPEICPETASKPTKEIAAAKSFDSSAKKGLKFSVTASALNVRASASSKSKSNILRSIPKGT